MYEWIGKLTRNERAIRRMATWCTLFPRPVILIVCHWISRCLSFQAKSLCRRIEKNMNDLLGTQPSVIERRQRYLFNVCVTLFELLVDSARLPYSHVGRFYPEGEHYVNEALSHGRGAIVYAPHVGNFFYYYWYLSQRYTCLTVVTAKSAELRPLYLIFQQLGCQGLDYDDTPPLALMRKLRRHLEQNGVVLLMGDFWRRDFPSARLFGRLTQLPQGAATLALEKKVPIVPFYGYRDGDFTHRLVFAPPYYAYEHYDREQVAEAMEPLFGFLENAIRNVPEQWLYWFNADERWSKNMFQDSAEQRTEDYSSGRFR